MMDYHVTEEEIALSKGIRVQSDPEGPKAGRFFVEENKKRKEK